MKHLYILFFAALFASCNMEKETLEDAIIIDFSKDKKQLVPFWTATGFSPAKIVERPEMKQILKEVGELPDKGISYIRPHYLLNLVTVKGIHTSRPIYDWSRLDIVLDEIVKNKLRLIFELMGTPSNRLDLHSTTYYNNYQEQPSEFTTDFDDFTQKNQIHLWKKFIADLARHLEVRYGQNTVRSWYFETTNEPDLDIFWKYDIKTFLNYFDACSEGLKAADDQLRFGGPGTANDLQPIFKELLRHCDTGSNFFTGEKGVRLDFISVHIKDDPYDMLARELETVAYIREYHPRFKDLPFLNDEADPLAGWARDFWWRKGAWYAAFVAQNIDIHQKILIDSAKVNYTLQSNDHTFNGYWHARTTHALLSDPKDKTKYRLIPKPVFSVMKLIATLGDIYVDVKIPKKIAKHFGIMASMKGKDSVVVMLYNKTSFDPNTHDWDLHMPQPTKNQLNLMKEEHIEQTLIIQNLPFDSFSITQYRFDANHTNPYETWLQMDSPPYPSDEEYTTLLKVAEPYKSKKILVTAKEYLIGLNLPSPSVQFLILTKTNVN